MQNVFIVHGMWGNPEENWFPWLKSKLEKLGFEVFVPDFPTPENQTLEHWLEVLKDYEGELGKDSIVVGHSLGVPFLMNLIEKTPVKAAFLVAGFVGKTKSEYDYTMKSFAQKEFDWKKIRNNCSKFYIYHSNNDPYVPLEKAKELGENLGQEVILVEGAGHFNEDAGYKKFELLLEDIKSELDSPKIKAVIFDLGGVYFTNGTKKVIPIISSNYNIPEDKVNSVLKGELGTQYRKNEISLEEFWNKAKKYCGINVPTEKLTKLWHESYEPIPETVTIIDKLREQGYELFYLSDNVKERVEYLDSKYKFLSKFKDGVFSHEIGIRKPNPKIYKLVLEKVYCQPDQCVYIDDKSHLLKPAKDLGMKTILFKNSEELKEDLRKLGIEV